MEWSIAIPAAVAVLSAAFSGYVAVRTRGADAEATRLRELESRLSEKKVDLYEPILNCMGEMLTPRAMKEAGEQEAGEQEAGATDIAKASLAFMSLAPIYASDEVLLAFMRFRMGSATCGDEPIIALKLINDFVLAVRRDMTGGTTKIAGLQLIGWRMNDLFTNATYAPALDKSIGELATSLNWQPPWQGHEAEVGLG